MKQRGIRWRWWLAALAALCAPWASAPVRGQEPQKPLRWGADEEGGQPYIFPDPEKPGTNKGFEVDLIALLAKELGREIEWRHYEFKSLLEGLRVNDFDLAMNGLEATPERLKRYRLSRPYYVYRLQLVLRRNDPRFGSLEEMKGRDVVVGTLEESAAAQVLERMKVKARTYPGQTELYKDLSNGRLDGVYLDTIIHTQYLPQFPDLRLVGPSENQGYYAIVFRKQDGELAGEFDKALDKLIHDGELERLYRKWRIWNDDQALLETWQGYKQPGGDTEEQPAEQSSASMSVLDYLRLLLDGAGMTVLLTVTSMTLAVALGLPIALARMYGPAPVRGLALAYVEFFRGIPVLLLLYFLYYVLPDAGLKLSAFWVAVLGFGINYAAYEAEIYRAGIGGIPRGQWEAAASLGMSRPQTFRRIILPQALRSILPPMTNDFVALFKDTSVVSVIAVTELTKTYQILSKSTFRYVEIGLVTAALYLVMSVPLGYLSRYLEKRWSKDQA
jgi:polar amino acid transport system substrate-binding protein